MREIKKYTKHFFVIFGIVVAGLLFGFRGNDNAVTFAETAGEKMAMPKNGLVAYWDFSADKNSTPGFDYGNSNSAIKTDTRGAPKEVKGVSGEAVILDGTNDFFAVGSSAKEDLSPDLITVAAWFRVATTTKSMYIVNKNRNCCDDDGGYALLVTPDGLTGTIRLNKTGGMAKVSGNLKLRAGVWHHVALVFTGKRLVLYANGEKIKTEILSARDTIEKTEKLLYIGAAKNGDSDDHRFSGALDDILIYKRPLAPEEIMDLYLSSDTQAPTIAFGSDMDSIFSGQQNIPVEARDNSEILTLDLFIDNVFSRRLRTANSAPERSFIFSSDLVADGPHDFAIVARDIVGNSATATAKISVVNTPELSMHTMDATGSDANNMILPTTAVLPGEKAKEISISGVGGEYEPVNLILRSETRAFKNLSLDFTPLSNGSSAIPASEIDTKIVKVWYQGKGAWNHFRDGSLSADEQILVPELLLNDDELVKTEENGKKNLVRISKPGEPLKYFYVNPDLGSSPKPGAYSIDEFPVEDAPSFAPFDLPKNTTKQIWITFHIPENSPPGEYRGILSVRSEKKLIRRIPVSLTVVPFKFSGKPPSFNVYYMAKLSDSIRCLCTRAKTEDQMRAELLDMKRHGVNPTILGSVGTVKAKRMFEKTLSLRQSLGMNNEPLFFLSEDAENGSLTVNVSGKLKQYFSSEEMKKYVPPLLKTVKSYGFPELYLYGVDEAQDAEVAKEIPSWKAAHESGVKVFAAAHSDLYSTAGVADILDMIVASHKPVKSSADAWHGYGKKVLNYGDPQVGAENPYLFRRNYGVVLWATNYDGAMDYAYQATSILWTDLESYGGGFVRRDAAFAYPTASGVIDTIAWEGYREAQDDFKYLRTLENIISEYKNSPSLTKRLAAEDAEKYLSSLRSFVLSRLGTGYWTANFNIDLSSMRKTVISHITSIIKS